MRHPFNLIIPAILLSILLASCITENLDQCSNNRYTLDFIYLGDGKEDVLNKHISAIDLLVYDTNLTLVSTVRTEQNETNFPQLNIQLNDGQYRCVAIANVSSNTKLEGNATGDKISQLELHQVERTKMNYDPIYMGEQNIVIDSSNSESNQQVIEFKNLHIQLKINLIGLEMVNYNIQDMQLYIHDYPANYVAQKNYVNAFRSFETGLKQDNDLDNAYTDTLNVIKSFPNLPLSIELLRKGRQIENIYLPDVLGEIKSIDLHKQEVYIPLEIIFNTLSIDIRVEDWIIEDYEPEFN